MRTELTPETRAAISRLEERIERLEEERRGGERRDRIEKVDLVCFSGEWDRLFAAFTIANGALAMGQEVHMFFTFWAAAAIRDVRCGGRGGTFMDKMIRRMLPGGVDRAPLSKLNWGGLGKIFLRRRMRQANVGSIEEMMKQAEEMGAHFHLCDTSASILGLGDTELLVGGGVDRCGVATFLSEASRRSLVLFI